MTSDAVLGHIAYRLLNAPVLPYPFPHVYVENVFPADFYAHLLTNLPPAGDYSESTAGYHGRQFAEPSNADVFDRFNTKEWLKIATGPFRHDIQARFQSSPPIRTDLRLIRDCENYSIGPHTDAPWKILSYLFYLPSDESLIQHGTSIYLPKEPSFRCVGGPHHKFSAFNRIFTAPFKPNSLLAFFKTDYSFHGVEPITIQCQRDLLLWNLYAAVKPSSHGKDQAPD